MFTDNRREYLKSKGFKFSYDLVSEVAYKETETMGRYFVVAPDGSFYHLTTTNIIEALGTY